MKRLIYLTSILLCFIGCAKSSNTDTTELQIGDQISFTATSLTRADMKNEWSEGNMVAIFESASDGSISDSQAPLCYSVVDESGALSPIEGSDCYYVTDAGTTYLAIYPYMEDASYKSYCSYMEETFADEDVMQSNKASVSASNVDFTFTHIYAHLTLNISLCEEFSALTDIEYQLVVAEESKTVTASEIEGSSSVEITAFVAPQESLTDAKIVVTSTGVSASGDLSSATSWQAGVNYNYSNITLEVAAIPSYIEFDNSISDSYNITKVDEGNAIANLLAQFRRAIATYDDQSSTMNISYLDGSESDEDIAGKDIMVYMPEYWYKYVKVDEDKFRYYISESEIEDGIHVTESLVGAYKGYVENNELYSRSGVTPTVSKSYASFYSYARERGEGFQMIDYEQHCTIALMLYAKYCDRDIQNCINGGNATSPTTETGTSNSLLNTDTSYESYCIYVNGLGIEGVFGGSYEFVEDVSISNSYEWTISNIDGSSRTIQAASSDGWITSLSAESGDYFDIVPTTVDNSLDPTSQYYCDYYAVANNSGSSCLRRSFTGLTSNGGVASTDTKLTASEGDANTTTRLAFRGTILIK